MACVGNQRQTSGAETGEEFQSDEQQGRYKRPSKNVTRSVVMVMMTATVMMLMRQKPSASILQKPLQQSVSASSTHVFVEEFEHVRLPNPHAEKGKGVPVVGCAADGRIDLQAMRLAKLR